MAATTAHTAGIAGTKPLRSFFAWLGNQMVAIAETNAQMAEVKRLQDMTDAQLAERGLTRDTIVEHVFRYKFYV